MEITGKVHCFFEQSGTFKNEFIKLGIPAEDYDIQNNFGETDNVVDLFKHIEDAYDGKPSLFDNIGGGGDIATNPPYKYAQEFIEKALSIVDDGHYVCMFLKVTFLEGKRRKDLFRQHPPKTIYVSSSRINCAKNGKFEDLRETGGSAVAYAWYVWQKGYKGATIIKWIN